MSDREKNNRAYIKWLILLAAVVAFAAASIVKYPRTGWSLYVAEEEMLTAQDAKLAGGLSERIKHVVVISMDTTRADHLGCYGYSRDTSPNIDGLADEGVRFNHAVSSVPITLPSHSTMLTGTLPLYHKVRDNNGFILAESNVTLAEILKENGFATGAVIGAVVLDSVYGLDQGFDMYSDEIDDKSKEVGMYLSRNAAEVTQIANDWLGANKDEKSFLFVHYFDPHVKYELHSEHSFQSLPFVSVKKDHYDSEIAYTDAHIGKIIAKLKSLGIYESTLLIVTGDHGESLGDHGESTHAYFIYHSTMHVPLIIRIPGGPEGKVFGDVAGLVDIVPTVCGALGIKIPEHVYGRDLFDVSEFGKSRDIYIESLYPSKFGLGSFTGLTGGQWKYIHTSKPELFDLSKDTSEKQNVYDVENDPAVVMQGELKVLLDEMAGAGDSVARFAADAEMLKRLESLGYVSGSVDDDVVLEDDKPNPRENLEVYDFHHEFLSLRSQEKFEAAKRLCVKMAKKWPGMAEIYFYLGLTAGHQQDWDAVLKHYHQYIALCQKRYKGEANLAVPVDQLSNAHGTIASVYRKRGDFAKAAEHFGKSSDYMVSSKKLSELAICYVELKDYAKAADCYVRVLGIEADSLEAINALRRLGRDLMVKGDYRVGLDVWGKVVQHRPADHNSLYNMSVACFELGEFDKSEEYLRKALKLDDNAVYRDKLAEIKKHR